MLKKEDEERLRQDLDKLKAAEKKAMAGRPATPAGDEKADEGKSKAMAYSLLGFEFAAIFFGFVYGSFKLDERLGTKPWLTLVGITLGFSLALYRLIFVARKLGE